MDELKTKWKSVRDYLKRIMDKGKSGAAGGAHAKKKWALFPFLSFLIPHMVPRCRLAQFGIVLMLFSCCSM